MKKITLAATVMAAALSLTACDTVDIDRPKVKPVPTAKSTRRSVPVQPKIVTPPRVPVQPKNVTPPKSQSGGWKSWKKR